RRQEGGSLRAHRQRRQAGRNDRRGRCDAAHRPDEKSRVRRLVSLALNQPLFMMLLTVLFIGAGVQAFRTLPVEAFPDVTDVQVTVITLDSGHAPEEVEKQVTIPMEIGLS